MGNVHQLSQKPNKSDAFVLHVGDKFLVRPASVIVGKKKIFRISNLTDFEAKVELLNVPVLDNNPSKSITIPPKHFGEFEIGDNNELAVTYTVTLSVGNVSIKAHGDSDPVIIIDPPA